MAEDPSIVEVLECLNRSGYMMESRIVHSLFDEGYFVEPNQSIVDRRTGKSREIDVVAEYFRDDVRRDGLCVKSYFVLECINNIFPFILTTYRPWSPNVAYDELYRYATSPAEREDTQHPFLSELEVYDSFDLDNLEAYSQYCAVTRKRQGDELMVTHPDDVHSSIQKLAEYVLDEVAAWHLGEEESIWRVFLWQPILVLSGDLYLLDNSADTPVSTVLRPVDQAKYMYNFHLDGRPESLLIDVVTERALIGVLHRYEDRDKSLEDGLALIRQQGRA